MAQRIALVLGAAGARGMAQIGVIRALQARGYEIAAVAGASSGALVGAFLAAGRLDALEDWLGGMTRVQMLRLLDRASDGNALFAGDQLGDVLRELLGDVRMESLAVDVTIVAADMQRQREVWLREGDLVDAVRASIAIPGLLAPRTVDGRELVDGGLLAPLPITASRLSAAHRLVVVDMHGWPQLAASGWDAAPAQEDDSVMGRVSRAFDTLQSQVARVQLALDPPDLVIRIPRDACLFYEFWRTRELVALGYERAQHALDAAGL